jgi:hypothetical protein
MSLRGNYEKDQTFTLATGETITGYVAVIPNTSPTNVDDLECKVADSGTTVPIGIAQVDDISSLAAGDTVSVRCWGVSKAIAAGAISPGAHVAPTATGLMTSTAPDAGKWFVGIALTKATAMFDELLILVKPEVNEA